jgi:rhodanese-related sulfurtransferase
MGFLARLISGRDDTSIGVVDAARRLETGEIILVDVREPSEWRGGHARQARHVPLATVRHQLDLLARHGKPVAFVCRSGHRSAQACRAARAHGIKALNVRGGMPAWARAGLPVAAG